ncbi:hypothetical protein C8Q79DRAFT_1011663 [Trametes meyenii]|nr:hypothetical protein C8Q79DRAFT_1011663 [Trametes meyenii]
MSAGGEREVLQDHDSLLELISPIDTLTFDVGLSVYIDFEYYTVAPEMTRMAHYDLRTSISKVSWFKYSPIVSPDVLSTVGGAVEAAAQMIPGLLKILDVVAEVHPFAKLVVSAFNVAYTMYKTQKENDKRITVLHVEMSYIMDELRILEHVKKEGMDSRITNRLQQLCRDTEQDIMSCSHACGKYAQKSRKRTFWSSSNWNEKFTGYVEIFRRRKEDFHRATTTLIKVAVDNITADVKAGVNEIKGSLKASADEIKEGLEASVDKIVKAHLKEHHAIRTSLRLGGAFLDRTQRRNAQFGKFSSLIQWLAFKALAWQSIAESSIGIIDALLDKMFALRGDFENSPETLTNVDLYLHAVWPRIFLLVLSENYDQRVLPLIAVLLERHYIIMQLAATVSLHPEELSVAANSILCVLDVMETRHKLLTTLFKHADEDVAKRIGQYACGLFNFLHDPSVAWSRQTFHKIAVITSKELEVEPTVPAHPEDLLLYAYGKFAKGRTTGKARYPTVHLDAKCGSCSRDIVGARTVCIECGTDVTKTVNFCSIPRCRNMEISVDTRPDLAAPHLLSHAVFRFEPQLHLRDFGRVDHQARKALEAAKKTLRAGNEPSCCHCGRPAPPPCWACITCPEVFLCEECELRRTNEHSATHGLVKCQDEQAAAERRTKAMESNILTMDGRMAIIERRMSAMEERLRSMNAHFDIIDRRMEHMTELLEKVAARRSSKK